MRSEVDLLSVIHKYGTDEQCRDRIISLRWPDGVKCLKCQDDSVSYITTRKLFECNACEYQFTPTVGTIFHDSHLPLTKWFYATYIICESRKGVSANQLKRMLRVTYKTAWYLCHRIRKAMAEAEGHKLNGTVEVDETYIGGKQRGHKGQLKHKAPVIGIRERGGHLHFIRATDVNQKTVYDIINRNVDKTVDVIMTDESRLYNFDLTQYHGKPEAVNHSADEYVRYNNGMCITTNSVESAFSLLKRGIVGTWHQISTKHLQAYLDEMTWRFNNRKNPYLFRDTILKLIASSNLEYKHLTAA